MAHYIRPTVVRTPVALDARQLHPSNFCVCGILNTQVSELAASSPEAVLEGLLSAAGGLSQSARQELIDKLSSSS